MYFIVGLETGRSSVHRKPVKVNPKILSFFYLSSSWSNSGSEGRLNRSGVCLLVGRESGSSVDSSLSSRMPESVTDELSMPRNVSSTSVGFIIYF